MLCFCKSATIHDRFATYPDGKLRHVTELGKSDLLLSRNAVFNGLSKLPRQVMSVRHLAGWPWLKCPLILAAINSAKVL